MNPRIDENALLAARAAGPQPPPMDRLRAAAEYVLGRTGAEQLILFGSAARGEFTPTSDFDFLAVTPRRAPGRVEEPKWWEHPMTGDEIDVLLADATTIEQKRWTVGTVYCEAMSQGRTVSASGDRSQVSTESDPGYGIETMAREKLLKLSEAPVYVDDAETYLANAKFTIGRPVPNWSATCKLLQMSAERSLKALHIANGTPVTYVHLMREAWEKAEELGERFEIEKNDKLLDEMTLYGGKKGYGTPSGWDPKKLAEEFMPVAETLLEHAQRRVPKLIAEHDHRHRTGAEHAKPNET